jgi:DNA-binding SARP family transcriptional activator
MVYLRTLSENRIELSTAQIGPDSAVLFGFLLFLAMHRGRPIARSRVRQLFWPGVADSDSAHSLRQILYRLRRLGLATTSTPGHITLDAQVTADFDVFCSTGADRKPSSIFTGDLRPFLEGYCPDFSEPFSSWLDEQRAIIHRKCVAAMLAGLADFRMEGEWSQVDRLARSILTIDPLNEEATLSLAEAAALLGSKAEAIGILDRYVEDIGSDNVRPLKLPPSVLRRRIAETFPERATEEVPSAAFVGRSESMRILNCALKNTAAGKGDSRFVWGPAGIGKTRLLDEFVRVAALDGARCERVACQPSDRQRPMSVFSDLVPRVLSLPGSLGAAPSSYALLSRLCNPDRGAPLPHLELSDAKLLASNIRRSLYDVLDAVTSEQCLLVLIEDSHWADSQSHDLLAEMAEWARGKRLSFIITSRAPDTPSGSNLPKHEIPPLDPNAIRALADALLPAQPGVVRESIDRWVCYSEGNPFYLQELIAHRKSNGVVAGIPPSLSSLLAQRLGALSPSATLTLQAVAILGRNSTVARLMAVLDQPQHIFLTALSDLERQRLIVGHGEYVVCAHDMIAHASIGTVPPLTLRTLHRLAGLALEKDSQRAPAAHVLWDCTRHWELAGDPGRGLTFSIECSKRLLDLGLPHEAVTLLETARPLAATSSDIGALGGALAHAYYRAERWRDLYATLAWRAANSPNEQAGHDEFELLALEAAWHGHERDHSSLLSRVLRCTDAPSADFAHRLRAANQGVKIAAECCNRDVAVTLYDAVQQNRCAINVDHALLVELEMVFHTSFGNLDRGAAAAREMVSLSRAGNHPGALAKALRFASLPYRLVGQLGDAEAALHESLDIARAHKLVPAEIQAAYRLGAHFLALHQPGETLEWCAYIRALGTQDQDGFAAACVGLLEMQAWLALENLSSAQSVYQAVAKFRVPDSLTRFANEFTAAKVRLQLASEAPEASRSDLTALLNLHVRTRHLGADDFAAGVLFYGLAECGEITHALGLFVQYVNTYRRDRIPFEPELARFANTFARGEAQRSTC